MPKWAFAWIAAVVVLGVVALVRGQVAAGAVVLGIPAAAFVAGTLARRWTESRGLPRSQRLLRSLTLWGPALVAGGLILLSAGAVGLARGLGTGLFGLVAGAIAVCIGLRVLQSRATVARLLHDRAGEAGDDQVVLVGRPAGPGSLLQPSMVVAVSERGVGFSRGSFRRTEWRFVPPPGPESIDIQITGSSGELQVTNSDGVTHLTAIDARDLEAARAILQP